MMHSQFGGLNHYDKYQIFPPDCYRDNVTYGAERSQAKSWPNNFILSFQVNEKAKKQKLQRDQELMNRLTGIWEDKWSKAQKMIQVQSF